MTEEYEWDFITFLASGCGIKDKIMGRVDAPSGTLAQAEEDIDLTSDSEVITELAPVVTTDASPDIFVPVVIKEKFPTDDKSCSAKDDRLGILLSLEALKLLYESFETPL